jgi:isopentenyl-diphosphate delta-isomerase
MPSQIKEVERTEIVDIVDDHNRFLYSLPKQEAHKKGLLHRTVIGILIDSKGRFTLVKQAPDKQDADLYVCPVGGHARSGETEEVALKRETLEETGLTDINYKLKGRFVFNRFVLGRQENHLFIFYEIYTDDDLKLNDESVSYKKFTKDEIKGAISSSENIFGAAFIACLENIYPEMLNTKH